MICVELRLQIGKGFYYNLHNGWLGLMYKPNIFRFVKSLRNVTEIKEATNYVTFLFITNQKMEKFGTNWKFYFKHIVLLLFCSFCKVNTGIRMGNTWQKKTMLSGLDINACPLVRYQWKLNSDKSVLLDTCPIGQVLFFILRNFQIIKKCYR